MTVQCMEALERANYARVENSKTMRHLRSLPYDKGCDFAADLIEGNEWPANSLSIKRTVISIRKIGRERTFKIIQLAEIRDADRRVRDLTDRQRLLIAHTLRTRPWRKR